ncbi:MAG: AAA family ATPase, partial [Anaerolineae bacterium]
RLLALTLLAYLPAENVIYLIEEPENGIHPRAIEGVFQSLSSVYEGQVMLATHSALLVGLAKPEQILCFARTERQATDIVRGDEHPALREWRGEVNLSELYAAGVLDGQDSQDLHKSC